MKISTLSTPIFSNLQLRLYSRYYEKVDNSYLLTQMFKNLYFKNKKSHKQSLNTNILLKEINYFKFQFKYIMFLFFTDETRFKYKAQSKR